VEFIIKPNKMTDQEIEEIKWSLPSLLPGLIDLKQISTIEECSDYKMLHLAISERHDIQDVLEYVEDHFELNLLYHTVTFLDERAINHLCVYTTPSNNILYKINFQADNDIISKVFVYKYSSIEVMLEKLKEDCIIHSKDEVKISVIPLTRLIGDFM